MPPVKSLGNSRAQYNYKFGLTGFEAALPPPGLVYSDDVFSTYLYEASGSTQPINNGIDLDGESGMVWIKNRLNGGTYTNHTVVDSERIGSNGHKSIYPNLPDGQYDPGSGQAVVTSFSSNGFTRGGNANVTNGDNVSWTFRKQPGFFTIKTWVGDGQGDRYLDHDLESVPGFVMVKNLTDSQDWGCYHRSLGTLIRNGLTLNQNYKSGNSNVINPIRTTPTASQIHIRGAAGEYNTLNKNYVAYIFAHDDQRFGTDKDESIIKCGTYSGNSTAGHEIDLGFEPQWILIKNKTVDGDNWFITDIMRGAPAGSTNTEGIFLNPNLDAIESTDFPIHPNPTGFTIQNSGSGVNGTGEDYIYVAIRRPHKPITDPTKLFAIDTFTGGSTPNYTSGFPIDAFIGRSQLSVGGNEPHMGSRLTGQFFLRTNQTTNSVSAPGKVYDYMDGFSDDSGSTTTDNIAFMFKRAPGFFDVVCWTGDGATVQNVAHNLETIPELVITKMRTYSGGNTYGGDRWYVYHKDVAGMLGLNEDSSVNSLGSGTIFDSTPTATNLPFKSPSYDSLAVNGNGDTYVAYLFASLPNVSKIGTYSGTGAAFNVDCGFSSSARFVLIKRTDPTGQTPNNAGWRVYDTLRGIVDDGNDPYINLNDDDPQVTNNDGIDRYQNGFALTGSGNFEINADGGTYIYLAIA